MENILKCPQCQETLLKVENLYKCINEHTFDLSKEGYLNLLLINQKSSNNPGDSVEMVNARRSFLELGYYDELPLKIEELISKTTTEQNLKEINILDAGCGEGYYLNKIIKDLKNINIETHAYGTDLSKSAITLAAKKYKDIFFAVSNINYTFPFADKSFDFIFDIFSPRNPEEFFRVLKENGKLIIVFPGINHLAKLREFLGYDTTYTEKQEEITKVMEKLFNIEGQFSIEKKVFLSKNIAKTLVMMTPIFWKIDQTKMMQLEDIEENLHFNIFVLNKKTNF